jgi:predicted nucleic acid-binding protein
MVFLDTSVLVGSLTGPRSAGPALYKLLALEEPIKLSSLVIYEWLRGPRTEDEVQDQERLFPSVGAVPFGTKEAALSADLYRSVRRARNREIDIAIAACAILNKARLWTLNSADFSDIPGLRLYDPKT